MLNYILQFLTNIFNTINLISVIYVGTIIAFYITLHGCRFIFSLDKDSNNQFNKDIIFKLNCILNKIYKKKYFIIGLVFVFLPYINK